MKRRFVYTHFISKVIPIPPYIVVNYLISTKYEHSTFIKNPGVNYAWGYNNDGKLGNNSINYTPTSIKGSKTFCQISAGGYLSLSIDKYGKVWSWGNNAYGQLGINSTVSKMTPVSILGTNKTFCQISAGNQFSLGIDNHGKVWGWGNNQQGQLGVNSVLSKRTPVSILGTNKTFCQISAGNSHSLGIDLNGKVWSWGLNSYGQLGDSTNTCKSTPVAVCNDGIFNQVSAGQNYSLGIDNYGKGWGWGVNQNGQIGNNDIVNWDYPQEIFGNHVFCQISAGIYHSLGIDKYNKIWSWGYNAWGELGNSSFINYSTPIAVFDNNNKTFCQICAGDSHSIALDNNYQIWGWGKSEYLNLIPVTPTSIYGDKTFCQISTSDKHSFGIDYLGKIWGWGYNGYGLLGNNSLIESHTPVAVCGNHTFCQISCGNNHSLGIDNIGVIWSWGLNTSGQLGINSTVSKMTPVSILGTNKTFCQISAGYNFSFGIDNLGKIWSWGYNLNGELGNNDTILKSTPVAVFGNHTFSQISAGNSTGSHILGIDYLGKIWSWGTGDQGQLGNNMAGITNKKSTPVAVCNNYTFCQISAGNQFSLGIDLNGKVWSWGLNSYGVLGINSIINKSTPVTILGINKTFCQISAGNQFSLGIDKYGKIWSWGFNFYGQLGDNTVISRRTPVSILGTNKTFCQITASKIQYHSIAIDNHYKAWGWGYNQYGELGTISFLTPIIIIF